MLRDRTALIDSVRSYFAPRNEARIVLVFGSVADGSYGDSSDVDIGVAGDRSFSYDEIATMGAELAEALGRPVDVVDLTASAGLIVREALVRGIRVKLDRNLYVRLHTRMLAEREDFWPLKRSMQAARIGRFVDGS